MTNADRIRNMSNWELAEFIYNVSNNLVKLVPVKKIVNCARVMRVIVYIRLESG